MISLADVWRILTLVCDESSRLVSESLDRDLTLGERIAVRAHQLLCWSCRRFRKQILFVREAIRYQEEHWQEGTTASPHSLSPEARERIKQALAHQLGGG